MNFQIEQLVIWPKDTTFQPRIVTFKLGQVNVITGASRTGKSAIIPIIDYCLGSSACMIPIGVIRETASWYGVVIVTDAGRLLLARRRPDEGARISEECYVVRGDSIAIPNSISNSNQNVQGLKELLDTLARVSYVARDDSPFNERLGFRDLTHLVFQSQDIVANQNIMFYKTHEVARREKLRNWFPFILGAETVELIKKRKMKAEIESRLRQKSREYEKSKVVSQARVNELLGQIRVAQEYGLYPIERPLSEDSAMLIASAKEILEANPVSLRTTPASLGVAKAEVDRLEEEETLLSNQIAEVQKRLRDVGRLRDSISGYEKTCERKIERLEIAKWIRENSTGSNACPVCGSNVHTYASKEIDKICSIIETYEKEGLAKSNIPAPFEREISTLQSELGALLAKKDDLQKRFDLIRARNQEAAKYQQQTKRMYMFLGQMMSTIDLIEKLSDEGPLMREIDELSAKLEELKQVINSSDVKKLTQLALDQIGTKTFVRLRNLDVEEEYQKTPPKFSIDELNLRIKGNDGVLHLLGEVGSASNWVSFHLAFTCALQEFFCEMDKATSHVPSFVVYDQPSQVYFPRDTKGDDPKLKTDEDKEAVRKMFETISSSIENSGGKWQAIILEHAAEDVYGGIKGVDQVEEWRKGEKLIPTYWTDDIKAI